MITDKCLFDSAARLPLIRSIQSAAPAMATSQHYRFPRTASVPKLLASLEAALLRPEAVFEEFERLQEFCRDHVTGDTDTATQAANRGKNRYES